MKIVFVGGLLVPSQFARILANSKGAVQNAADALQKALIAGFVSHHVEEFNVVNIPFVKPFPRFYREMRFPACIDTLDCGVKVNGEAFINIAILRFWSRMFAAFRGLRRVEGGEPLVVVVYSAHLPFLVAARALRWLRPQVFLCAVIPDLPEFMGVGGRLYRALKAVESALFRRIIAKFDSLVFLTDAMGERIGIPAHRRIVVEGIYDPMGDSGDHTDQPALPKDFRILYTGTLAERYGIVDLLEAFEAFEAPDARLWICGDGDTRAQIEALANRDPRVTYFGQVPRARALELQRAACVLVNPRRPEGEFTKYSFPSKTMEYLVSGKPVIMHGLPGMPAEYAQHLTLPPRPDAAGLHAALREVAAMPPTEREARGVAAREFILSQKSPGAQVGRILAHWATLMPPATGSTRR